MCVRVVRVFVRGGGGVPTFQLNLLLTPPLYMYRVPQRQTHQYHTPR